MAKTKNPMTCKLQIGDRIRVGQREGTLVSRNTWYPSFNVRYDGEHYDRAFYRDQLTWIDSVPTEPEPYEAWFVA